MSIYRDELITVDPHARWQKYALQLTDEERARHRRQLAQAKAKAKAKAEAKAARAVARERARERQREREEQLQKNQAEKKVVTTRDDSVSGDVSAKSPLLYQQPNEITQRQRDVLDSIHRKIQERETPSAAVRENTAAEGKEGEEGFVPESKEEAAVVAAVIEEALDQREMFQRSLLKIVNSVDLAQGKMYEEGAELAAASATKEAKDAVDAADDAAEVLSLRALLAMAEADVHSATAAAASGPEETKDAMDAANNAAKAAKAAEEAAGKKKEAAEEAYKRWRDKEEELELNIRESQFVNEVNRLKKINFELSDELEKAKIDKVSLEKKYFLDEIQSISDALVEAKGENKLLSHKNKQLSESLQQSKEQVAEAATAIEEKNRIVKEAEEELALAVVAAEEKAAAAVAAAQAKAAAEMADKEEAAASAASAARREESKLRGELKVKVFRAKKELTKVQKELDRVNKEAEEQVSDLKEKLKIKYQELEGAAEVKEELKELKGYFNENLEEKIRDNIILAELTRLRTAKGVDQNVKDCIELLNTKLIEKNPLIKIALDKFMGLEAQRGGGKKRKTKKRKGGRKTKKRKGGRKSKKVGGRKSKRKGNRKTRK